MSKRRGHDERSGWEKSRDVFTQVLKYSHQCKIQTLNMQLLPAKVFQLDKRVVLLIQGDFIVVNLFVDLRKDTGAS